MLKKSRLMYPSNLIQINLKIICTSSQNAENDQHPFFFMCCEKMSKQQDLAYYMSSWFGQWLGADLLNTVCLVLYHLDEIWT